MDKDVLIRFIAFLELVFGRINSKRLMVIYGFLLFLLYSKEMTEPALWMGLGVSLLGLLLFWLDKKQDAITTVP